MIKEASNFRYKLWENHDFTVQQVITNIYLFERAMVCKLFTLLFKPPSCNGPDTELKRKIGFRNYINNICILSYRGNWCLVPFCINISGDSPHRMCLCFDYRNTLIYPIQFFAVVGFSGGGGLESWVTARKFLHILRRHKLLFMTNMCT